MWQNKFLSDTLLLEAFLILTAVMIRVSGFPHATQRRLPINVFGDLGRSTIERRKPRDGRSPSAVQPAVQQDADLLNDIGN